MKVGILAAVAVAGAAWTTVSNAAQVIFNDFGSNYSYLNYGLGISGPAAINGFQEIAEGFTSNGSYILNRIDLGVTYEPYTNSGPNELFVSLWTNNNGNFGTELGSWQVSGVPCATPTTLNTPTTISGISGIILNSGSYWLMVQAVNNADFIWNASPTSYGYYQGFPGLSIIGAFDLIGDASSAVPEPGAWALILGGFGASGIAIRMSRRRHRHILEAVALS
jgi:hypothetical protein